MKKIRCLLLMMSFFLLANYTFGQSRVIKGKVTDEKTGQPLAGVTILVSKNKGIVTKQDGTYAIKLGDGVTALTFSFVGYTTKVVEITSTTQVIDVALEPAAIQQAEVVVIGYGTRKKAHMTGSFSKLSTDQYTGEIPVARADDALKGKLAGVNITTTDAQAGAAPTIQIRGATSITAETNPLIVIDGYPVPTDLSAIDMNDVESITVLKDAASTAIYGSRGGNGVILVTTKSGKSGQSKVRVNVSTGVKSILKKIKIPMLAEWKAHVLADNNGVIPIPGVFDQAEEFDARSDPQDYLYRQVKYTNIQLSTSGGTNTLKYYLSGSYIDDGGIMLGNGYKKAGMRASFSAKIRPKITLDFGFTPSYTQFFDVPISVQEVIRLAPSWMPVYHNAVTSAATGMPIGSVANVRDFSPNNPKYTGVNIAQGTGNGPLSQLTGTTDKTTNIRNITNIALKFEFNQYFSFKTSLGLLMGETTRNFFQKSWAQAEAALDGDVYARSTSKAVLNKARTLDISNDNLFTYKRVVKKHDIEVIAGFSEQFTQNTRFIGQAGNFATDDIPTLNAGVPQVTTSTAEEEALISYLARVNYAFSNKYLVSISERIDGSSRFAPGNRYAAFPSASLGWKLSEEGFFPRNRILTEVKFRGSYGATGNKNIGNYKYYANVSPDYVPFGSQIIPSYVLTSFANNNLKWERTFSSNLGADLGFFKGKLNIVLDYYNAITDRLLLNLPIATSSGFATYTINQGKVRNRGYEIEITAPIMSKKKIKWDISANAYTNKNTLLDFGGTDQLIQQGDLKRANFYLTKVGSPLVQYYGYQATESVVVKSTTNNPTDYWPIGVTALHTFVKDQNKDGIINDDDRVVLGDPYPKFNWGFTNNFRYKSFDFSFTLQGSHGAKVFNIDPYYFDYQSTTVGSEAYKNTDLYTPAQQQSVRIKPNTDFNIQDASFIALRNLNVGYAFPEKFVKKLSLSTIRMYASSSNLWYHFADSYTSYNPEADNGFNGDPLRKGYQRGAAPLARTITFGVNVEF